MLPAAFMTSVCTTFICTAKIGLNLPASTIPYIAVGSFVIAIVIFYRLKSKVKK
jgi:hypothetical protein